MSVIFLLSTLQLPEYVVDLTIKSDEKDSDEKLNLEVRVSCLYFSALFWSSFSPTKLSSLFFFSLSTAPRMCGRSDYQKVKIHKILVFNDSRRIESCCNAWSMKGSVPSRIVPIEGFTGADVILVVGQTRQNLQWMYGKIVILMLDNSRKDDILKFLWIAN